QERKGDFRPDARHLQQAAKQAAFLFGAEAEEKLRVLAHDEVREEPHVLADGRQMKERRHRRFELIAHPAHLHGELRRGLRSDAAANRTDHRVRTGALVRTETTVAAGPVRACTRRVCAWQTATASASDASAEMRPCTLSTARIMCATCVFSAPPKPTSASLMARGAYSNTGIATGTAHSAAPRACPS